MAIETIAVASQPPLFQQPATSSHRLSTSTFNWGRIVRTVRTVRKSRTGRAAIDPHDLQPGQAEQHPAQQPLVPGRSGMLASVIQTPWFKPQRIDQEVTLASLGFLGRVLPHRAPMIGRTKIWRSTRQPVGRAPWPAARRTPERNCGLRAFQRAGRHPAAKRALAGRPRAVLFGQETSGDAADHGAGGGEIGRVAG